MTNEKIQELVEEAMNPETFDVLSFISDQPVATDSVTIYTNVAKARKLHHLREQYEEAVAKRKKNTQDGKVDSLSIADDNEEAILDEEINELVEELEKTKLTFKMQTVSPKLVKSIEKKYLATMPKDNAVAEAEHNRKGNADILSRAISEVVRGDGAVDTSDWDADRLIDLEERLYDVQSTKLFTALYDMVNTGYVFTDALTTDF